MKLASVRIAIIWVAASLLVGLSLACGSKKEPQAEPTAGPASESPTEPAPARVEAVPVGSNADRFTQSFANATTDHVLDGQLVPVDVTMAGKSTAVLRAKLEDLWSQIPLTRKGMTIPYLLTVETSEGTFEISLAPHLAPNHVRNMVALAQLGYYDGLCFERTIRQEAEINGKKQSLDVVTGGCPKGTGEDGIGHLGYFLKGEMSREIKHEEGTVGFWRDSEDTNSAGTRFYITMGEAPVLDGEFTVVGKVTRGLDVVKLISAKPVMAQESPFNQIPVKPVVIKKVTVSGEKGEGPIASRLP